jgi:putative ABC transport system permease protein
VADGAVIIACAGGLAVLHQQGLPRAGIDLYASAAPVLIAAPVALLVMRLYPLALRWLLRMTARRRGMTAFVGLARAARGSAAAALPAFALVLALAVVAFGAMMREAIARGQAATSWQVTGADAMIGIGTSPIPVTPPLQHAVGDVPGVRRTAAVFVTSAAAPSGTNIDTAAVDPGRFAALTAQTPYPAFPAALLSKPESAAPRSGGTRSGGTGRRGTVPVLASRAAVGILGRGVTTLRTDNGALRVRVAGILAATAALPGESTFIIVPAWATARLPSPPPPNLLLVSGPRLNQPRLAAVVHRMFPGGTVAFRAAALAALARAPLPRSAYLAFAAGTGAAAGFSVIVLLLALLLGSRSRELTLARLSTMGMGPGQGRRLAMMEAAPSVLAALAGGTACAWGLAALIGPTINLSPFTGSGAAVSIRADPAALAASAAGLAALALVTLIIQTAVASRRGPARALRAGG